MRMRFNMYPSITINGSARGNISSGKAINTMEEISNKYYHLIWDMLGQGHHCKKKNLVVKLDQ